MIDERLKKVDEFLELLSKKFNSIKSLIMVNIFERECKILVGYIRGKGFVDESRFINFEFQKDVHRNLQEKNFVVFEVNPKERIKIYPWLYEGVDLPKVYICIFPLSAEEKFGLLAFMFEAKPRIDEIKDVFYQELDEIPAIIRQIHEEIVMDSFAKSTAYSASEMLKAVDSYTYNHSIRVADFSHIIASHIGVKAPELLEYAGLIHDVGKLFVPREILLKKGELTPQEYEEVKKHVYVLDDIFAGNVFMGNIVKIARLHHERLDGSGYMGMDEKDIPLEARILAVADVADAMLHDRPYRKALDVRDVITILRDLANKNKLDGEVVNVAAKFIKEFYSGFINDEIVNAFPPSKNVVIKTSENRYIKTRVISSSKRIVEVKRVDIDIKPTEKVNLITPIMGVNKIFGAKLFSFSDSSFVFHILEDEKREKYVSIPWNLDFYFIKVEDRQEKLKDMWNAHEKMFATTTVIGGNEISFTTDRSLEVGDIIMGTLVAYKMSATFVGMIYDKSEVLSGTYVYNVEYLPMPERNISQIFKLIFKKQVDVRMKT